MSAEQEARKIHPFTPVMLEPDDLAIYVPEFEAVFSDPAIRNIALAGSFGAGKTSVIRSWEKHQHEQLNNKAPNYLYLSLANFKGEPRGTISYSTPASLDKTAASANSIETMLLNQLAHKVPIEKSPRCRIRRTSTGKAAIKIARRWAILVPLLLFLALLISFDLQTFGGIPGLFSSQPFLSIVLSLTCLTLVGMMVYYFILCRPFQVLVNKVKILGNEIELNAKDGTSVFDHYIDDILYLFRASGCEVVVFEDLDRFDDSLPVFEDLREVNDLLNYNCGNGTPVRLLYLVKDDMFKARDRTKFFDLIIPVIPYVDPSNADGALVEELLEAGLEITPGFASFASELSLYIDDMRIIHDIANTSGHIKAVAFDSQGISPSPADAEKITALATLKALHPQEYAQLQVGEGTVKKALEEFVRSEGESAGDCKNPLISYSTERSPYTGLVGGPRMLSCWPSPGPGIGSIPLPFKGLPDHATRTRGAAYRQ